jgi:hypothetical protein
MASIDNIMAQLDALQSHLGPDRASLDEEEVPGWDQVEAAKVDLLMLAAELESTKKHVQDAYGAVEYWKERACRHEGALEQIVTFGHSHGHGRGYTCAEMAQKSINGPFVHAKPLKGGL